MSGPLLPVYAPFAPRFTHGEGVYLYDADGKRYLDFGSGVAVSALGHCAPKLVEALHKQSQTLWHLSNWYQIDQQTKAALLLTENSFADHVFFCNSGAEAIECGLKVARHYFASQGKPERYEVITCQRAFHGRTFACLSASHKPGFEPLLPGFKQVPFNDLSALEAAIGNNTAAVLLEPIQGEGGIFPAELSYLKGVRQLTQEKGILLFLDEIQSGIGRSGKLFAHEWAEIKPDILASAKGIGGGFPVGACLTTHDVAKNLKPGLHGSTYGGNPLATAVVEALLQELLAPGFLEEVDRVARSFWHRLVDLVFQHRAVFSDVRGAGLMLGLVCQAPNTQVCQDLMDRGLLTIPAGDNTIRLLPPLIVNEDHCAEALGILESYAQHVLSTTPPAAYAESLS